MIVEKKWAFSFFFLAADFYYPLDNTGSSPLIMAIVSVLQTEELNIVETDWMKILKDIISCSNIVFSPQRVKGISNIRSEFNFFFYFLRSGQTGGQSTHC